MNRETLGDLIILLIVCRPDAMDEVGTVAMITTTFSLPYSVKFHRMVLYITKSPLFSSLSVNYGRCLRRCIVAIVGGCPCELASGERTKI